ncbi:MULTISPECIES: Wzz/FepE/Etk N-terminal domain-containing protein [Sphingobacterium]|uniref:Wzz/FepE/Etk N-terminal domain-containing protein n=1 Tax=Sphingobacterium TaxID=28453 RepID=UPI00129CB51E|nr:MULTISPECIES: Wzz/FepE/Etk N-terminal domain-containing protein [Sphingobacterium]MCS4166208.1 hypothetical protein [Sphingobacterium sp. BIGb0116]
MDNGQISARDIILKIYDWVKYISSQWKLLMIIGLLGGGLGFIYAKFTKPTYTATTTFVLESDSETSSLGQYASIASMVGVNLGGNGGGVFQGDNLFAFYKSRRMLEKVLLAKSPSDTSKLMIDRYLDLNEAKGDWAKNNPKLLEIDFRKVYKGSQGRSKDSLISKVISEINKKYLVVDKIDKKLSIMKVDVVSNDEIFSKEFNELLVNEVNNFYIQTKTKKSLDNVLLLQRKADSVRSVMNGAIEASAVVLDATPNLNPTRQVQRIVPTQKSQFSAEANKAILSQLVQNLELSKLALAKEAPLIEIIDKPLYPLEKNAVSKLKAAFAGVVMIVMVSVICLTIRRMIRAILLGTTKIEDES